MVFVTHFCKYIGFPLEEDEEDLNKQMVNTLFTFVNLPLFNISTAKHIIEGRLEP